MRRGEVAQYTFDPRALRYRNAFTGRFIPVGQALQSLENDLARMGRLTDALADDYRSGRIALAEWRVQMQVLVKHIQLGAVTLAKGGRQRMAPADYGRVGQMVAEQYRHLDAWTQDLASGQAPTDGRMTQRARLYATAGRPAYVAVRAAEVRDNGFDQERSILHPADHCDQCEAEAARGFVPMGELVPIGGRECGVNDRCSWEARNSVTGETIAA